MKFLEIIFNNNTKTLSPDNFMESSYFNEMKLYWYLRYHYISEEDQFSCNSMWFDVLFKTHSSIDSSEAVAGRCSIKKVFLQIWKISHENICVVVSF